MAAAFPSRVGDHSDGGVDCEWHRFNIEGAVPDGDDPAGLIRRAPPPRFHAPDLFFVGTADVVHGLTEQKTLVQSGAITGNEFNDSKAKLLRGE